MEFLLIEAVQMHPCLFDKSIMLYRNKVAKEKAWRTVAADTNATVEQCQSRWRSLRDRYVKENNRDFAPSGSGAKDGSGWRYMDAMSFLQRHVAPRRTTSNIQWAIDDTSSSSFFKAGEDATDDEPLFCSESAELSPPLGQSTPHAKETEINTPIKRCEKRKRHEDKFETLCSSVSDWIKNQPAQSQNQQPVSRNADFLKVLDGYLMKHSEDDQDLLKVKLLNMVCSCSAEDLQY